MSSKFAMKYKTIELDNLLLFNKCVQESGGIMEITSSYTDHDGNVSVRIYYTKLTIEKEDEYERKKIKQGELSTIEKIKMVLKMTDEWIKDQSNGLTDGEICIAALKDIKRILFDYLILDQ
jgi:hypothetical protein